MRPEAAETSGTFTRPVATFLRQLSWPAKWHSGEMRALIAMVGLAVLLAGGCTGSEMKSAVDGAKNDGTADGGPRDDGPADGGLSDGGTPIPFITQSWTV